MKEDFLQFIWKMKLFDTSALKTICGVPLKIIQTGIYNRDSGPDFFNARIKMNDTIWAGNIEIHNKSSDWFLHQHQHDAAYENIILHVVYEDDLSEELKKQTKFKTLCIAPHILKGVIEQYQSLKLGNKKIACEKRIHQAPKIILRNMLDRTLLERLAQKTNLLQQIMTEKKGNREESCYIFMASAFGFKVNSLPFELLAKNTPLKFINKIKQQITNLEALLLGQSGFLNERYHDTYPQLLHDEYCAMKQKFGLTAMGQHLWKFSRLRPANFPTIRIVQFASFLNKVASIFHSFYDAVTCKEVYSLLDICASSYWTNHYLIDKLGFKQEKTLGDNSRSQLIANGVAPIVFYFAHIDSDSTKKDFALHLLESARPEKNVIIEFWKSMGVTVENAYDSQAVLELNKNYCDKGACLHCSIGHYLLKNH